MIIWGLFGLVGCYLIYVLSFYALQRRVLFPIHELPNSNAQLITDAGGELIRLPFSQGEFEVAYLPPLVAVYGAKAPVLVLAHGNGNIIDDWAGRMDYMRQQGFAVVLVEYPGYGRADGVPSFRSIKETMLKAYDWVERQPGIDQNHIALLGRSMGGGAVLSVLSDKDPSAVVLMSTYSSVFDLARQRWIPRFLVRDPFDNVSALSGYKGLAYLVHGEADKTVPISALTKLLAVKQDAQYQIYSTGHTDTPKDWDEFWGEVAALLRPDRAASADVSEKPSNHARPQETNAQKTD